MLSSEECEGTSVIGARGVYTGNVLHSFKSLGSSRIISTVSCRGEVEMVLLRGMGEMRGDLKSSVTADGELGEADHRSSEIGVELERENVLALNEEDGVAGADMEPYKTSGKPGGKEALVVDGRVGVPGAETVSLVIVWPFCRDVLVLDEGLCLRVARVAMR